jgi:D-alanyl-D-alanine carboxypeptidase/D-alanyl-D-alanine-endopeptidase (penicillin-binding protein 4)
MERGARKNVERETWNVERKDRFPTFASYAFKVLILLVLFASGLAAQEHAALARKIQQIVSRPEFKHAQFGIEFYDLTGGKTIFALNQDKLFVPGSTTKLVTEGTALALLGPDYRFHTRVYRTGPVTAGGVLEGDLVLVAGGDPNLSARVQPGDTLAYTDYDHAYAGSLPGTVVPGDPLTVLKDLAKQVAAHGIWRIQGSVRIDASLFRADKTEPGTGATISPVVVNDSIVDVTVTPSAKEGGPTAVTASPFLPYLQVINQVTTGKPDSDALLQFTNDIANPDGTHTVTLSGTVPAGWETSLAAYKVKSPVRFAESAFVVALQTFGIQASAPAGGGAEDFQLPTASATPDHVVAEHVSPPFRAELKVTLKVSQNLHAATMPYFLGAALAHHSDDALAAGFSLEREFLKKAGLDLSAASQADGIGGPGAAFSPNFMVHYLAYMVKQPFGPVFFSALPIMGRDGTLVGTLVNSPAAGHVHAKTGTYVLYDGLNHDLLVLGKELVGYVDTRRGHRLAFALFVNQAQANNMEQVEAIGDLLAEMAGVAYESE